MRIAFVGLPVAAICLAKDGHEVVWAGICRKDAPGVRRLRKLVPRVAIVPDLERVARDVATLRPDLVVSWFWTKRIPPRFLAVAPGFGVHPSLLPRHRGPDPYFWTIDAGDAVTGVTAHVLEAEYDTGAILAQRELRVDPAWNAWTLAKKLDRPSLAVLREVASAYARGAPPAAAPQDEARATAAPQPTDDDLELRWDQEADAIVRRIRAASPWPGAFTAIGDATVAITAARATDAFPRLLAPGQAFVRKDGRAVVRAQDRAVELLAGRLDEDESDLDAAALAEVVAWARDDGDAPDYT